MASTKAGVDAGATFSGNKLIGSTFIARLSDFIRNSSSQCLLVPAPLQNSVPNAPSRLILVSNRMAEVQLPRTKGLRLNIAIHNNRPIPDPLLYRRSGATLTSINCDALSAISILLYIRPGDTGNAADQNVLRFETESGTDYNPGEARGRESRSHWILDAL